MYANGILTLVGIPVGGTIEFGGLNDMCYSYYISERYLLVSMS